MDKFCVFCGKIPEGKTKEHIIPQWLIELTGNPKRNVKLVHDFLGNKDISFSYNNFTFPACDSCNGEHSQLEGTAKSIVLKILSNSEITESEVIILLDWFDKVRVGLWLGQHYLTKGNMGIEPMFFIKSRIGAKDRALRNCFGI